MTFMKSDYQIVNQLSTGLKSGIIEINNTLRSCKKFNSDLMHFAKNSKILAKKMLK